MEKQFITPISTHGLASLLKTANTTTDPVEASITLSSLITLHGQVTEQIYIVIRDQITHRDVGGEYFEYI